LYKLNKRGLNMLHWVGLNVVSHYRKCMQNLRLPLKTKIWYQFSLPNIYCIGIVSPILVFFLRRACEDMSET
jgi:hypothetical protein